MNNKKFSENGNVLFLILIAVALFAALSYVVTQSTRSSSGNTEKENAKLIASEILNYFTSVQTAITRLTISGCSHEQISFEDPANSLFVNPVAPSDYHCHVFRPEGGGVPYKELNRDWNDPDSAVPDIQYYWLTGSDFMADVGTTCGTADCVDLVLGIYALRKSICEALNELSGERQLNTNIPTDTIYGNAFDGTFTTGNTAFTNPLLRGKLAACYNDTSYGYSFISVLIAR